MLNRQEIARLNSALTDNNAVPKKLDNFNLVSFPVNISPAELKIEKISQSERKLFYPPAQIVGVPADEKCLDGVFLRHIDIPRRRAYRISNGRVVGWMAAADQENILYASNPIQSELDYNSVLFQNSRGYDGFLLTNNRICVHVSREEPVYYNLDAIFLPFVEQGNYGSFLFRALPQILFSIELMADVDCYIVPERTPWLRQSLELVGAPDKPIFTVKEVCGDTFRSIVINSGGESEGFLDSATVERIRDLVHSVRDQSTRIDAPIYSSRLLNYINRPTYRPLLNEKEIHDFFVSRHFDIVYPEVLSLKNQIIKFSSAEYVVGPSGSGMLNSVFLREDALVIDMESYHNTVRQHAKIYSSTQKKYKFVFGDIVSDEIRPMHNRAWSVKISDIATALPT